MQSDMAAQSCDFTLGDVADAVREKLFAASPCLRETVVSGSDEVVRIGRVSRPAEYGRESALDGVQRSLPGAAVGLVACTPGGERRLRLAEHRRRAGQGPRGTRRGTRGADGRGPGGGVWRPAVQPRQCRPQARHEPEDALRAATGRFEARFRIMERKAKPRVGISRTSRSRS